MRYDWQYYPQNLHRINFGIAATNHHFKPGVSIFYDKNIETGEIVNNSLGDLPVDLFDIVAYIDYEVRATHFLTLNAGFRITDIKSKEKNFIIPEPRLSGTIQVLNGLSMTAYYAKTSQYFHLLRSSILELPTDLWLPASSDFPPEKANQVGLEANYQTRKGLEFSVAGYYKNMDNLLEYREGTSIFSTKSK